MNRAAVATWVGNRYGAYLAAVGRTTADTAANMQPILDDTLWALGYAEAAIATADPTDAEAIDDFKVMAAFQTMAQIVRDLGAKAIDISTEGDSFRLNQRWVAAKKELEITAAAVEARGLSVYTLSEGPLGFATVNYNFLAPTWSDWA